MNSAAIVVLSCLLLVCTQGQKDTSNTCRCSGYTRVQLRFIKEEPVIYEPTVFCPKTEIIVRTAANELKCLDPASQRGQMVLSNKKRQETRAGVTMTTSRASTSRRTSTSSRASTSRRTSRSTNRLQD